MDNEKLRRIVSAYGEISQVDIAIEEMSELIKALLKHRRMKKTEDMTPIWVDEISEEMADVKIMLSQLEIIFNNHDSIEGWIDYKIDRQIKRITQDLETKDILPDLGR